ncbi:putative bifunctional diguanylate cyclase/phosphodiesterase [Sphaerotilus mobilis]|uniref:Diguanylate cyclase/phosphodiesterase with PAS/PAC sensor(S) n=1 Tax=Sphaerotilus mobilis TaxID=47994 RepID=A0A4Q7LVY0_9BURK|nr:EAL domain-containing protein [Sphaerotilus mobilis]RZS58733.1 diguanylate cyclase/phosphodiesterase with PAS/PAC sensor(s) [Sphaerotilus mobilis]
MSHAPPERNAVWPPDWLAGLPQAACLVDPVDLTVRAANAAAARLHAQPMAALVGLPVVQLAATPEDQLFWLEAADPAALTSGMSLHTDSLVMQPGGRSVAVERRIAPVLTAEGGPAWLLSWIDREAEQRLAAEVGRLAGELGATLASSRDAILVTDLDGRVRGLNAACAALWDLPEGAAELDGWDDAQLLDHLGERLADPLGYADQLHTRQQALGQATPGSADARCAVDRIACADGRIFERRLMPQYGHGRPVGWIQVWHDLSPALAQEARLQLASQVFDASLDALLVLDAHHRVIAANPAAAALTGQPRPALLGRSPGWLLDGPAGPIEALLARVAPGRPWRGELQLQALDGIVPVQAHLIAHAIQDDADAGACIVVLRDLRERVAQQRQLRELAETDGLTGLPNRIRLEQQIQATIERQRLGAAGGGGFALLMVGLERLDRINDSLGHGCGDQVLVEMARRVGAQVRGADTLGRLAGDSFVLMLDGADAAQAEAVGRRLLQVIAEPLTLGQVKLSGLSLTIKASAGVALFPADGVSADTLLRNADSAMQAARLQQGGELRFYQPAMNRDLLARLQLDQAMRLGLAAGQFRLQYQPQVDLRDGRILGAEALCRWTDPQRGPVSPAQFIGVAEETGFIAELGDWVLHEAVAQAARWHRAGRALPVSVNVSALQFRDAGFVAGVARALAEAHLPPGLLELELTESLLLDEVDAHLQQLQALADLGVRLAIDDFGTGYSSLRYLKRLPIHRLKIDREFIRNLPDDTSDRAITHTIVQLAQALGLDVIAEGVETDAQHRALCELGCASFQGFLVAGALTVPDFEALLDPPQRKLA